MSDVDLILDAFNDEGFKGASTFEEWKERSDNEQDRRSKADLQQSITRFGDMRVAMRWNEAREDARQSDAMDCLLSMMAMDKRNFGIQPDMEVKAGDPKDLRVGGLSDYKLLGQEPSVWFKELLSRSNIIAFPAWWVVEAEKQRHISLSVESTKNMRVPFPRASPEFIDKAWKKWYPQQTADELKQWQKDHRKLSQQICEATPFPEMIPYSSTFIALEPVEGEGSHLLYQRVDNQQSAVREHNCPTQAFPFRVGTGPVPLDAIYCVGFLLVDIKNPKGQIGRIVLGLYHGYVISNEHCPPNKDFVKVPFTSLLYIETNKEMTIARPGKPPQLKAVAEWTPKGSTTCMTVTKVIQAINDHRTIQTVFSKSQKRKKKKLKKSKGITTRQSMYTRVQMSSGSVTPQNREESSGILPRWKLGHRVSCRSHERCYIKNGPLPLTDDVRKNLIERGYTIYTDNLDIGLRDARRMRDRRARWPDGVRFTAIKTTIIKEHERGPKDKEVVPMILVPKSDVMKDTMEFEFTNRRRQ
jgi:hypothetical protein